MNTHKNAHLTPKDRDAMVRAFVAGGLTKAVRRTSATRCRRLLENGSIASSRSGSRANAGLLLLQQTTPAGGGKRTAEVTCPRDFGPRIT